MSFTEDVAPAVEPIWTAIERHPMVAGIGDGTLDREPFAYWVKQDYRYLIEYSRVFAYGAGRAPSLDEMGKFAELLAGTLNTEMDLHRAYAAEFGISSEELEATDPSPTTQAYTDFLVRTAAVDSFGELIAALVPCMWGFHETGKRLAADGLPDHPQYREWIEMYTSDEFAELTTWCLELMDRVADDAEPEGLERFREHLLTSARYEYRFWDAAWEQEDWTV